MKSFEVGLVALAREVRLGPGPEAAFERCSLTLRVDMDDDATPEDAVRELARRLERLCETPEYEGG